MCGLLAAALVLTIADGGDGAGGPSPLLYAEWRLVAVEGADGNRVAIPEPERFTIRLGADGTVAIRADCNRCSGLFQAADRSVVLGPTLACTRAYCPGPLPDADFEVLLAGTTAYEVMGDALTIHTVRGTLRFSRVP